MEISVVEMKIFSMKKNIYIYICTYVYVRTCKREIDQVNVKEK